ncbi:hypothetical protein SETIT_3G136200v2 [Setaria italica]|uniref:Uncharacterized protein n=1 Tax=Setaria italica TaxID=4555 RepID=A0A368QEK0_SETIT|nr:hypothetical protein SETIT_3G136200v2 [Setaria italica]
MAMAACWMSAGGREAKLLKDASYNPCRSLVLVLVGTSGLWHGGGLAVRGGQSTRQRLSGAPIGTCVSATRLGSTWGVAKQPTDGGFGQCGCGPSSNSRHCRGGRPWPGEHVRPLQLAKS